MTTALLAIIVGAVGLFLFDDGLGKALCAGAILYDLFCWVILF